MKLGREIALYAVSASTIESVARQLQQLLGIVFHAHDSEYWGIYLLHREADCSSVKIYCNKDSIWQRSPDLSEEQFLEPEHPKHMVLVEAVLVTDRQQLLSQGLQAYFPGSVKIGRSEQA